MLDHISNYFLPIKYNTTYQKIVSQSNRGVVYENVQFEYLIETYINNENTDSMKNWYYTYGYNLSDKDKNNIFFTNTSNTFNIFNNTNTAITVNPTVSESNWKLVNDKNNLYNQYLPEYSEFMRIRLFIPKINIAAWGENEQYIINTYFTFNGKKIYLSSGISSYLNLNANEYKSINNQIYSQYLEFYIPSPYAICEDDVWSNFRSNILNINNIINSQQVTFEILPYDNIDSETDNIYLNYAFNQSNYTWINSNNPWYLTLSNNINKNILNINVLYPDTYLSLKDYLNNFKFYSYNNESSNISFDIKLTIYDLDGNVYWGDLNDESENDDKYIIYSWSEDERILPQSNISIDIQNLPIPLLTSLENFQDNIVIRTYLTIRSDLRYAETNKIYMTYPDIQLLSNRIPLTQDIFKYLVNGFQYNNYIKINYD